MTEKFTVDWANYGINMSNILDYPVIMNGVK